MRRGLLLTLPLLLAAAPFDPFGAATIDDKRGAAVPLDDMFRDQMGRPVTLRQVAAGRPILLAPVLHDCPNFCGVTLDNLAAAVEKAAPSASSAAVIAFGIDPREGPVAAATDVRKIAASHPGAGARIVALTGSEAAIRHVTNALGYQYAFDPRIGQYAHAAAVAALTPDGHLSRWLYGIAQKQADVVAALADARARRSGGIVDRLILLCYHYDPEQGRYGLAIDRVLKAACAATLFLLLAYVLLQRRREKRTC